MLAVADVKTLWRRRPFEALAKYRSVVGFIPEDPVSFFFGDPSVDRVGVAGTLGLRRVLVPPGWASWSAWIGQRLLGRAIGSTRELRGIVVTTPHYLPLLEALGGALPEYYFCSDDYRSYQGWDRGVMAKNEKEIVLRASHSFFVSQRLLDRACDEYGVARDRASVVMNATDPEFLVEAAPEELDGLRREFGIGSGPVAGVAGAVNSRLDFELLLYLVESGAVGALVFAGTVDGGLQDWAFERLRAHPLCVWTGTETRDRMRLWQQLFDVGLVPYRRVEFNQYCSPMRLFDHLAAGKPLVATSACSQITDFTEFVVVADEADAFTEAVRAAAETGRRSQQMVRFAAGHTWDARALQIRDRIG